jgi:4-hydroxybenzoate polyprenyltransferase
MLWESVALLARERPLDLIRLPGWLIGGRAQLKQKISSRVTPDPETLPYRQDVLDYIRDERARGRTIVLVTATDEVYARAVADYLGLFDKVVASDGRDNVKGPRKLAVIRERLGPAPFDYIGDSTADLAVWQEARRILVVSPSPGLLRRVGRLAPPHRVFDRPGGRARSLLRMLRPHQWAKNVLLFVPLFTSHTTDPSLWLAAMVAFVAFSLAASSVYIVNDLLDLQADRRHATKRRRPLAAGDVPIPVAAAMAAGLLSVAALLSATLPAAFAAVLLLYVLLTTGYSFYLKRKLLVDVLCLAALYTIRIHAGGAATGIETSPWLNAFSMFLFLSLAYLKRFTELAELADLGSSPVERIRGRGYMPVDLELIRVSGIVSGFLCVLVFCLYINAPETVRLYRHPDRLWLACPVLLYFINRVFFLAQRGQMPDDPVVFALKDWRSLLAGLIVGLVLLLAI